MGARRHRPAGELERRLHADLSDVAGIAPAGSSLALQISLVTNSRGNPVTLYVGDSRASGDASGSLYVDENTTVGTLLIGDTTNPGDAVIGPGAGSQPVDAFTLATTAGTAPVFSITAAFDAGTAAACALVEITNAAGTTTYGSVSNPTADTFDIPLTTNITATTTPATYRIRITPKAAGSLAVQTYVVRAVVYDATTAVAKTITDADSSRIIVDNAPPSPPTGVSAQAGYGTATVSWTNPLQVDLAQLVVVRDTTGSFVSGTPTDGASYGLGNALTGGIVACVAAPPTSTCADNGVTNGQAAYYIVYAKDSNGNYSSASGYSAGITPGATTTVGDGSSSASTVTICPAPATGATATVVGTFSLQASTGSADTVTGLKVRLASGTSIRIAKVDLTTSGGAVIASQTTPSGDDWTFSGLSLSAPVSPAAAAQYRIQVTPKQQSQLPGAPGAAYGITARVVAPVTHTLATNVLVNDTAEATVTLDNQAPADATNLTGSSPGSGAFTLTWTNPVSDFGNYAVVLRSAASFSARPSDGAATYAAGTAIVSGVAVACSGDIATCADTGLVNGTTY